MYQKKKKQKPRKNRDYIEILKTLNLQNGKEVINFFKGHSVTEKEGLERHRISLQPRSELAEEEPFSSTNGKRQSTAGRVRAQSLRAENPFLQGAAWKQGHWPWERQLALLRFSPCTETSLSAIWRHPVFLGSGLTCACFAAGCEG